MSPAWGLAIFMASSIAGARSHPTDQRPTNGSVPITNSTLDRDPYLDFQPIFADSLPVQILLTGMVLALVFVLFVHLVFTAQYHWPLARLNYALQMSGVCTLMISLLTTLVVVLKDSYQKSRAWPYMLDYISQPVPLASWTQPELVSWYFLQAAVSGIVNVRHLGSRVNSSWKLMQRRISGHSHSIPHPSVPILCRGPPDFLPIGSVNPLHYTA